MSLYVFYLRGSNSNHQKRRELCWSVGFVFQRTWVRISIVVLNCFIETKVSRQISVVFEKWNGRYCEGVFFSFFNTFFKCLKLTTWSCMALLYARLSCNSIACWGYTDYRRLTGSVTSVFLLYTLSFLPILSMFRFILNNLEQHRRIEHGSIGPLISTQGVSTVHFVFKYSFKWAFDFYLHSTFVCLLL